MSEACMEKAMPGLSNCIIDIMDEKDRRELSPHLKRMKLEQHETLYDAGDVNHAVYFVFDAVVSLVVPLESGDIIETAMVGRDGIVGADCAPAESLCLHRAVVQLGGECLTCPSRKFWEIARASRSLMSIIGKHQQVLLAQAQQSAACNSAHVIEERFARWLLRAADLHGSASLPLTQDYVSQMLGVRRTSVTVIANTLQRAGMIKYSRGTINLLDVRALRDTACECYRAVRSNYEGLCAQELVNA